MPIDSFELLPPERNEGVGYAVFRLLEECLKHKDALGLPKKWSRHYDLARNRHWKNPSAKMNLITANLIYAHRTRTVNMMTDNNPTFNIGRTTQEEQSEAHDNLLRTAEHWWTEEEQQAVLEESVTNGEMNGCAIEKVHFDPEREFGLGEVETDVIDPFQFAFYPPKCRKIQKCEAVFHFYPISVREARRRWPDSADAIRPDHELLEKLGDTRAESMAGKQGRSAYGIFGSVVKFLADSMGMNASEDSDDVLIVECWNKDYTMEVDEAGENWPKYPGWIRCVTTCCAGEVVLSDRPNPSVNPTLPFEQAMKTYLFDKFPFIFVHSVTDTVNPWGMSDFEQLAQLQEEIDKTLSQMGLLKDRAARSKIINPRTSGVPNSDFNNLPGVINPSTESVAAAIRYMSPPEIPADLMQFLNIYKDYFFLVAGSFELEQAQTPGRDVIAYKAIAALLERAATMLRGKIRNYSRLIRERGRMFLSCAQNWYTEDRFITYSVDGVPQGAMINGPAMIVPAKLTVVSGSTMPRSQIQEREEAITLFQMGAIDRDELLGKLDWPNRKAVLQRMNAGPMGALFQALGQAGAPPEFLQILQSLPLDPQELDKAAKNGQLPDLSAYFASGEPAPEDPSADIERGEKQAGIEKTQAEAELIREKAQTEKVNRRVSEEKLNLEKAKTADDLDGARVNRGLQARQADERSQIERAKAAKEMESAPPQEPPEEEPDAGV